MMQKKKASFLEFLWGSVLLALPMAGINLFNKLIFCSIFMVISLGAGLLMQTRYDRQSTFSILLNAIFLHSLGMTLIGNDIYVYSFIPFGCACFVSGLMFEKLQTVRAYSDPVVIFLALVCGVVVDGLLIAPWEAWHFGLDKLPWIMVRSFSFKTMYAGLLSLLVFSVYDFRRGHFRWLRKI